MYPAGVLEGYVVGAQVGFLLRRVSQRHTAIFVDRMAGLDLTPTQFTALIKVVELGRATQSHLGRLTAMDPVTIQGGVRRLIDWTLVWRMSDPLDRRTTVLMPTSAGVALANEAVAVARQITAATLRPLTADEGQQPLRMLRKLG